MIFLSQTLGVITMSVRALALATLLAVSQPLFALEPTSYGPPIPLEQAKKLIISGQAEAAKQNWPVAIAIVDSAGHLVAFEKMDNTQLASIEIALEKAKCSVLFRRATKVFEDGLVAGGANNRVLKMPGAIPVEGGIPIIQDGKIIGAIGVSGVKPSEDGQVAQAAIDSMKPKP
jgi:glc operon protein GlcG